MSEDARCGVAEVDVRRVEHIAVCFAAAAAAPDFAVGTAAAFSSKI